MHMHLHMCTDPDHLLLEEKAVWGFYTTIIHSLLAAVVKVLYMGIHHPDHDTGILYESERRQMGHTKLDTCYVHALTSFVSACT